MHSIKKRAWWRKNCKMGKQATDVPEMPEMNTMPLNDRFAKINRIDQAIYESEKEMQEGGESLDLDDAFEILNNKYTNELSKL
jgi:hypothetical protein